jgi:hypothetical protein
MLCHVLVWLDGGVAGESHSVLSTELAEWLIWVGFGAGSGSLEVEVINVQGVDVFRGELGSADVGEEASSLI